MPKELKPTTSDEASQPDLADENPYRQKLSNIIDGFRHYVSRQQDQTSPIRLASHAAVLFVAVLVLVLSQIKLPQWDLRRPDTPQVAEQSTEQIAAEPDPRGGSNYFGRDTLIRNAIPFTQIPDRPRLDIITYTVQLGDTVYDLAQQFRISPETIMWANGSLEDNPDLLRLGQQLVILPVSGVYHKVQKGDTIDSLAKKYKVPASAIVGYAWNNLTDVNQPLALNQMLIVPGGAKPYVAKPLVTSAVKAPTTARKGSGVLIWPASGRITQGYWSHHPGIDIAARMGSQVKAADAGYVVAAGWSSVGYGYHVVIDHGNGMQTLYAHLSRFAVKVGDSVARGQVIGYVGSTGNSTGPHLHFEVRRRGVHLNPLSLLP